MATTDIRVSIVEDNEDVRESLAILINGTEGLTCVSTYRTAEQALADLPKEKPDVVLMDINLPLMSGIECVKRLKTLAPTQTVVMLTAYGDDELIFQALSAGATGYLLKHSPVAEITAGIIEVQRGGAPMSSNIALKVIQSFHSPAQVVETERQLSARERDILDLLVAGYTYKEIAEKVGVAYSTIDFHVRGIYDKLHLHSRAELAAKFRR